MCQYLHGGLHEVREDRGTGGRVEKETPAGFVGPEGVINTAGVKSWQKKKAEQDAFLFLTLYPG